MVSHPGGAPILDVLCSNDVLVVAVHDDISVDDYPKRVFKKIVKSDGHEHHVGVRHGSLLQFHPRLTICVPTRS